MGCPWLFPALRPASLFTSLVMPKQSIALAYSRPPDTLGEAEYHALVQALAESARGRAFLEEHARRSRSAETKILLTAIERIEAQVRPHPRDPVYNDLGQVLEELRTARARIESGGKVAQADQLGALLELLLRRIGKMLPPSAAQAKRLAPPPKGAPAAAPRPAAARWLEEPLVPPPAVNDVLPRPAAGGIAAKVPATPRPAPAVARRAPAPARPAPTRPASSGGTCKAGIGRRDRVRDQGAGRYPGRKPRQESAAAVCRRQGAGDKPGHDRKGDPRRHHGAERGRADRVVFLRRSSKLNPFVPAKAGTQNQKADSRLRGNERNVTVRGSNANSRSTSQTAPRLCCRPTAPPPPPCR